MMPPVVTVTPEELQALRTALHDVRVLERDLDAVAEDYGLTWGNASSRLANQVEELLEAIRQRSRPAAAEPSYDDVGLHLGGCR